MIKIQNLWWKTTKKCFKSACKHKLATCPLTHDVTCFELQRDEENTGDKKFSVVHTLFQTDIICIRIEYFGSKNFLHAKEKGNQVAGSEWKETLKSTFHFS